ncbi:MAG: serine/threonine protein kinase [Chitinophagaceae bacterium]|nr:serine/threonine protein kinase [Oligoflexus sp.]
MAEIYLGKAVGEAAFQKIVAIKRILPHYAADKEFIEMFRDEAHICKRLQHNNIVAVYDFTEVDGSYALVMEHVDGADLRSLLSACETAKTRLSVPMALFITACSARALHYSHTKTDEITNEALGIVHRDVSPQNILISYEGDVKITDFGIASAENKLTETRPGVVKGKYSYMSPEQVAAKPLDGRSDVFSLAIVLWESLAMKRLFAGMTEVESIRKVQNCEIPYDLCELNPEVDPELKALVMKGLSKDRKQRYQTAAAFEKDLLRYLHSRYSEFTSRELGNFLKRILAKKRDRTQDDIKETLAQESVPVPAQTMAVSGSNTGLMALDAGASRGGTGARVAQSSMTSSDHIREDMAQSSASSSSIPRGLDGRSVAGTQNDDLPISLTGLNRKHLPRNMITDSPYGDNNTNTRGRGRVAGNMGPARPIRKQKKSFLPWFVALLAILGGLSYVFKDSLIFDKKMHIELRSLPEVVSLKINGVKVEDGAYQKVPIKLHLRPGAYEVEVSRPGYQKETIRFEGAAGETLKTDKIFLKRMPHVPLNAVKVLSTAGKISVDIDSGLYTGEPPLMIELQPGQSHTVTFHTVDDTSIYKCQFKVDRPETTNVSTLMVTPPVGTAKPRCQFKN